MNTGALIFIMMMMVIMIMASVSLFLWHFCIKVFLLNCHKEDKGDVDGTRKINGIVGPRMAS